MSFERVAAIDDIPIGGAVRVRIEGIDIGLFRVGDEVFAMENACPHAGIPLSLGQLDGPVVTCAAHGWRFDVRTGFRPDDADGFPIPCFAVDVVDGEVHVDIARPVNPGDRG
jgi:nitrite reductase/ring-hydroxylating ferredoxin subunit